MADDVNLAIENLKLQFSDIKQKISEFRKKGKDVKIAELKLMMIPPKIRIAEATKDLKDVKKIDKMMEDIRIELSDVEK